MATNVAFECLKIPGGMREKKTSLEFNRRELRKDLLEINLQLHLGISRVKR